MFGTLKNGDFKVRPAVKMLHFESFHQTRKREKVTEVELGSAGRFKSRINVVLSKILLHRLRLVSRCVFMWKFDFFHSDVCLGFLEVTVNFRQHTFCEVKARGTRAFDAWLLYKDSIRVRRYRGVNPSSWTNFSVKFQGHLLFLGPMLCCAPFLMGSK